jgi:hypothetical protein
MSKPTIHRVIDGHGHGNGTQRRDIIFMTTRYQDQERLGCIVAPPYSGTCCVNLVTHQNDGWTLTPWATYTFSRSEVQDIQEGRSVLRDGHHLRALTADQDPLEVYLDLGASSSLSDLSDDLSDWIRNGSDAEGIQVLRRACDRISPLSDQLFEVNPDKGRNIGTALYNIREHLYRAEQWSRDASLVRATL